MLGLVRAVAFTVLFTVLIESFSAGWNLGSLRGNPRAHHPSLPPYRGGWGG